ncbi:MAG: GIY-YIG nuclease family protein [Pseudomonadota bacterium]
MSWCVYIVECADGSLYTGITNDLEARVATHNSGKGARYTAGRGPVTLRWSTPAKDRADATRLESGIKRMPRKIKLAMIRPSP